jgi:hypothetical protein
MSITLTLLATAGLFLSALSLTAVFVPIADAGDSRVGPPVAVGHVTLAPRDPAVLAAAVAGAAQAGTFTCSRWPL